MPDKCFVPGCTTGYASNKEDKIGRFHPPKGKLEEWSRAIPRDLVPLRYKDVVCERHFDPEEVISKFIIKMPDGTVIEEPRDKKTLVKNAVPHIFPNLPKYLSSKRSHRKSPKKRYTADKVQNRAAPETINVQHLQNPLIDRLKIKTLPTPLKDALLDVSKISLPCNWRHTEDSEHITFMHSPTGDIFKVDRTVSFEKHLQEPLYHPTVKFNGTVINLDKILRTKEDLEKFMKEVHALKACPGTGVDGKKHSLCRQVVCHMFSTRTVRCKFCQRDRSRLFKYLQRQQAAKVRTGKKAKARIDKKYRMKKKMESLKQEVKNLKGEMSTMTEDAVEKVLVSIPEEKHKEVVRAIIMASKCKTTKNRRYSNQWMYECILMRIKSPALYRKMLRDNLLPLPSFRTIQRFLKRLKPQFGFHEATFKLMTQKAQHLEEADCHGVLMVDEMATEQNIEFNKNTGQVHGMVDLGSASPSNADSTLGDHSLVFLFQPFKGQWFQTIGAFCSKGAAKGEELQKLVTEAIILLFKHGYYVDVVTTDGGSWNRNMWTLFGVNEEKISCVNPAAAGEGTDEGDDHEDEMSEKPPRRLWFLSDFPHLVKSMWSRVRTTEVLQTPDGIVKLDHWRALAAVDDVRHTHINICHKLTNDHIDPSNWQSMNVQMAFQFFHDDVADAMEHYRDKENVGELQDCHATVEFIRRTNRLRKAMNANHSWDSLRANKDNEGHKAITDFLSFLDLWKQEIKIKDLRLAWQTELGLKVTLKATLELCAYLKPLGFEYLMTRRLNQDPLEHFFGKIRQACGANQHPDPLQFIQVYRLLSTASLIKPPRGSNVTGGEMLNALTSLSDVLEDEDLERKANLEEELDRILDNGDEEAILEKHLLSLSEDNYIESTGPEETEHCYNSNRKVNPYGFQLFGGYVARKVRAFSTARTCDTCFQSLSIPTGAKSVETQSLIDKKSRGFLLKPSTELYNFLVKVENVILTVLGKTKMNRHILLDVVDELPKANIHSEVGCDLHKRELTKQALMWYLNTRMIFACKRHVKVNTDIKKKKKKAKSLSKKIKLNAIPVTGENAAENEKAGDVIEELVPEEMEINQIENEQLHVDTASTASNTATPPKATSKSTKKVPLKNLPALNANPKPAPKGRQKAASKQPPRAQPKAAPNPVPQAAQAQNAASQQSLPQQQTQKKAPKRKSENKKKYDESSKQHRLASETTSTRSRRVVSKKNDSNFEYY